MGLDAGFLELLTHTVTLKRLTGEDSVGNNTYGADEVIPCFITELNVNFAPNDTQNRQRVGPATGSRIITDYESIMVGDRIVMPDGQVTTVIGAQTLRDETDNLMQNIDVATEKEQ